MRTLLAALLGIIRLIPGPVAVIIGRAIGWLLRVIRFRRLVIDRQLALAYPQRSTGECRLLRNLHYRHLGLLVMELLRLPRARPEIISSLVDVQGEEHLQAALARGKGVLLITGHLGNWELAGVTLSQRGYQLSAIGKEMKSPAGETLRHMIRDENGVPTIPRRGGMRQILQALKNNQVMVVLIDQNMTSEDGIFADFYGVPACTMTATAVLANRTGAAVLPGFIRRDDDCRRHHVELFPHLELDPPAEDADETVRLHTTRFNRELEAMIDRQPPQWMWIHKRWRTRPEDENPPRISYKQS